MMLGLDVRTEFLKVLASIIRDLQLNLRIDDKQTPAPHPMRKYKICTMKRRRIKEQQKLTMIRSGISVTSKSLRLQSFPIG